ncbi:MULTISPECIES: ABC transporter family substrate-binding protein [unclassified Corynebacterium]|uniref:ABC transporter family substrate-binding protein n=1 Tax=unclassified Corynebacterium TaxID=2624378 RepID=UPI0029C9E12E|nr:MULTISPECIES: ABC transporter family substrate-binding protein [unclassified Corynebacterium]WPF67174.1 ABC transporter family substrate-binding protein [Corynebacterium sp. 22KM0430]WPF69663.1 ABC transporter family substrate-binding protein [Corynebacterium sp. 21KM1197]
MKKISLIALLIAATLGLASCNSMQEVELAVSPNGAANKKDPGELRQGGTLTLPISEIPEQQNPLHANATAPVSTLWGWYMPQMMSSDSEGNLSPNSHYLLDVSEEVREGKTVVTYTLNPQATFNDGTALDWRTFENTWRINRGDDDAYQLSSSDGYNQIESVRPGADEKQAVVTYRHTYPWWRGLFGQLLHPSVTTAEDFNEGFLHHLPNEWGAGPYRVESVDYPGGTVTFVPNEKWWGSTPKLDKVIFRQMESQASLNAFRAGEIDSVNISNKNHLAAVLGMGKQAELHTALDTIVILLSLNAESPVLSDIAVREAVMSGIDRSLLATIQFTGMGYTEDLPGSMTFLQNQEGYADILGELISFDPDYARDLLDRAGWVESGDGIRVKEGERLTLRYPLFGDSAAQKAISTALQKMLRNIGVELKIQSRPSADFAKVLEEKDFDLIGSAVVKNDPNGTTYFRQQYYSDSTLNLSSTGTAEIDAMIDELEKLPTAEEQNARAVEIERVALGQFGLMPYANGPLTVAVKPGLANVGSLTFGLIPKENIGWVK